MSDRQTDARIFLRQSRRALDRATKRDKDREAAAENDLRSETMHGWFELTYAQYLTLPRSIMQAMPGDWQERMVTCLQELDAAFDQLPEQGRYWVKLRDSEGRFKRDRLRDYRHPDYDYINSIRKPVTAEPANA